jgi:coenzyme F420-reducing hydrogenase beta subunit
MEKRKIFCIRNSLCTGCGSCVNICPVNALELEMDEKGYLKPFIKEDRCIDCGLCDKVCPIINQKKNIFENDFRYLYAMWARDEIRKESSSGGAFTLLAEAILDKQGVVFGAAWTDKFFVVHKEIFNSSELKILQKSKYLQSNVQLSFRHVEFYLQNNKFVLFVGTPCQVGGLKSYIKTKNIDDSKLFTVDLYCYSANSYKLFKNYIDTNFGNELESFNFRLKDKNIYTSYFFNYKLHNKEKQNVYEMSPYFTGYFNGLYTVKACTSCIFQNDTRVGDISLGDFWGIENHDKYWNDGLGTSMLLVNSLKGKELLNTIEAKCKRLEKVPLEWIRAGQGNRKQMNKNHQLFYDLLDCVDFNKAVSMALDGKKYDLGVACVQVYKNYGSAFTNFALYNILRDYGKEILLITQPMSSEIKPNQPNNFAKNPYPVDNCAKIFNNKAEMRVLNNVCNKFLVGSDQLFNYEIYKRIDSFTKLDWVDDDRDKLSYATSFGLNIIMGSRDEQNHFKECIQRFKRVSVRESTAIGLVKNNFGIDADCVLDPVFMCDIKHYKNLIEPFAKNVDNKKIFCYILDPDENNETILKNAERAINNPLYVVTDMWRDEKNISSAWQLKTEIGLKNEEWLANLANSSYILTDSFHCLCYALIFNVPFVVLNNKKRGVARFESLLEKVGLQNRLLRTGTEEELKEIISISIDWKNVNNALSKEIIISKDWIEKNIIN